MTKEEVSGQGFGWVYIERCGTTRKKDEQKSDVICEKVNKAARHLIVDHGKL